MQRNSFKTFFVLSYFRQYFSLSHPVYIYLVFGVTARKSFHIAMLCLEYYNYRYILNVSLRISAYRVHSMYHQLDLSIFDKCTNIRSLLIRIKILFYNRISNLEGSVSMRRLKLSDLRSSHIYDVFAINDN